MTAARTIAVQDQVLAVLRDEYPVLASTKEVCERIGVQRYDNTGLVVYRVLDRLAHRGDIQRVRFDGMADAYWRATGTAVEPCPVCGTAGACSYDAEGRPLIHTDTELPKD